MTIASTMVDLSKTCINYPSVEKGKPITFRGALVQQNVGKEKQPREKE